MTLMRFANRLPFFSHHEAWKASISGVCVRKPRKSTQVQHERGDFAVICNPLIFLQ